MNAGLLVAGRNGRKRLVPERVWIPMLIALLLIAGFQFYWVMDNYRREKSALVKQMSLLFRETLRNLQDSILEERLAAAGLDTNRLNKSVRTGYNLRRNPKSAGVVNIVRTAAKHDSSQAGTDRVVINRAPKRVFISTEGEDSNFSFIQVRPKNSVLRKRTAGAGSRGVTTITLNKDNGDRLVLRLDSLLREKLNDTLVSITYQRVLKRENLPVPFEVKRFEGLMIASPAEEAPALDAPFGDTGLYQPLQLIPGNLTPYLVRRIAWPILFSLLLVSITTLSFIILYRSLLKQYRLSRIKNELISNITHELKTPIATVGVAIEALRNFNAIQDIKRTDEYLSISQQELQRLGLLVDKVLNLSMFESKNIELHLQPTDIGNVVNEVVASLKLQLEKQEATLEVSTNGDLVAKADCLHLISVVFNLLDNALKYAGQKPVITIEATGTDTEVRVIVTDNGIGIPAEYIHKVFDKFFRVPQGDRHNAKGHGLGLSYVNSVVRQHGGSVHLESNEGQGSRFTIILPKNMQ